MAGRVIIGYDGTDRGEDALALGCALAGPELPLVVTVFPEETAIGAGRVDAEWEAYVREHAEEAAAGARVVLERWGTEADVVTLGAASPARGLHDLAEREGAAAVVVGSGRRGPRRRIAAGSTAERLAHGTGSAVAVAPRGLRERAPIAIRRVGVAYVGTPEAQEALAVAIALAQREGAHLRVCSVIAPRSDFAPFGGRAGEEAFREAARAGAQEDIDAALARVPAGVEATAEILEGDAVDELAALDEREIDVLVCGSRGYGPVRRVLLGGVSGQLIRRAASPLLIAPRGARE